ncbi:MAG: PASTA domain-containing protein, partial [Actinomycetota bacterium]|nr:PASTA domain-containing protein [Actinomycetota bacterium]
LEPARADRPRADAGRAPAASADGPLPGPEAGRPHFYDRESEEHPAGTGSHPAGTGSPGRAPSPVYDRESDELTDDGTAGRARPRRARRRAGRVLVVLVALLVLLGAAGAAVVRFVVYAHVVPGIASLPLAEARADVARAGLRLEVRASEYSSTVGAGSVVSASPAAGARERAGTVVRAVVSKGHEPVAVPRLVGVRRADAVSAARAAHLVPVVRTAYSETVPAGVVLAAVPSSGTASYASPVHLTVSAGPAPRTIPSGLDGAPWATVEARLAALRLVPVERLAYSSTVPSGDVVSSTPAPGVSGVAVGSRVGVVVSRGPFTVAVPDVRNVAISQAVAMLTRAGLRVTEQIGPPFATYATTTDPAPGSDVRPGTPVTLYVA